MFRIFSLIAVMLVAVLSGACSREAPSRDQDLVEVRKVLEQRDQAIENKNIDLYRSIIYAEYFDGGAPLAQILDELQSAFERYDSIDFTYQKSPVEFKMNTARVVQRIIYRVVENGEERSIHGHERLILRKLDGRWVIAGGIQTSLL